MTVLVGIAVKGNPIAGVIHQPYYKHNGDDKKLGRTTWGIVGYGIGGFKPQPLPPGFIVLTTRTHSTPIVEEALAAVKPDQILRLGGAGTKVGLFVGISLQNGQLPVPGTFWQKYFKS